MFDINPIYLVWLFVALAAGLTVEAVYLMCFSAASYRSQINRRLMISKDRTDRESVLVELRRERGLTAGGDYRMALVALNRLILQSGLTIGITRIFVIFGIGSVLAFAATMIFRGSLLEAALAAVFCATALPYLVLKFLRSRRQKQFGAQFPDALDIITRSLRAGHPVPIAITMVGREMADPIGTNSAWYPTRSPTAPISKARCATSMPASAPTTCRCSSPRWRSRARPAAISAKFWKIFPA